MSLHPDLDQSPMAALLGQAGTDDPRTMLILNALQQATSQGSRDAELQKLRGRVEALMRANSMLHERLRAVSAALGACPRCLGDDHQCAACGGDGAPGMRRPAQEAFTKYVVPAVHRLRRPVNRTRNSAPPVTEVSHDDAR